MSRSFPDQYVLLETRNISIDVNQPEPFDIIALQVDQLRDQKEKIATLAQSQIAWLTTKYSNCSVLITPLFRKATFHFNQLAPDIRR